MYFKRDKFTCWNVYIYCSTGKIQNIWNSIENSRKPSTKKIIYYWNYYQPTIKVLRNFNIFCLVSIDALFINGKYLRNPDTTLTTGKTKYISVLDVFQALDKHASFASFNGQVLRKVTPKGSNFNLTTGENSQFIFIQHGSKYYRQHCPEVKRLWLGLARQEERRSSSTGWRHSTPSSSPHTHDDVDYSRQLQVLGLPKRDSKTPLAPSCKPKTREYLKTMEPGYVRINQQ